MEPAYEAILVVGFGGPERKEEIIPFLENVLRGRNVPRERMLEVARHYEHFDGVSPLNAQVRELIDALRTELDRNHIPLPIYWGNRNWHPMLADTIQQMTNDGIGRAVGLVLAAYSSYSSCRQYLEDIGRARLTVGARAPRTDKIRVFYNHPDFITANVERIEETLTEHRLSPERMLKLQIAYTAHSLPSPIAEASDYVQQLEETCRLISERMKIETERWRLVFQSRSGRPSDPWLEPDICDHLVQLKQQGVQDVVVMPIGFLSDHLEVLYDLDMQARGVCDKLGLNMFRASTVGTHPLFVGMLRELIQERLGRHGNRRAIGRFGPSHDDCPADCCPAPTRRRPTES